MNVEMAYLIGMILGNGEIQTTHNETIVSVNIPYKNLYTDNMHNVAVYTLASLLNIKAILEPLIQNTLVYSQDAHSITVSFKLPTSTYIISEILHYINGGKHHTTMKMSPDLFYISYDEKRSLLKGIADVTGYIRKSNRYIKKWQHRVYIEVPQNWSLLIDIANMLKEVDVPIQTIDFGHPNFRDSNLVKYNEGKTKYWKKEHQIKIFANEFLSIGFNIQHKQEQLAQYAQEILQYENPNTTHKFYWEKPRRINNKPIHPGENDQSLPVIIRGLHFDSWCDLAERLGYDK